MSTLVFKVILAQATNIYFDQPQEPDPKERGLYWATRFTDTLKVLKFMPDSLYDNIFEERSGKHTTKHKVCGQDMAACEPLKKKENVIGTSNRRSTSLLLIKIFTYFLVYINTCICYSYNFCFHHFVSYLIECLCRLEGGLRSRRY